MPALQGEVEQRKGIAEDEQDQRGDAQRQRHHDHVASPAAQHTAASPAAYAAVAMARRQTLQQIALVAGDQIVVVNGDRLHVHDRLSDPSGAEEFGTKSLFRIVCFNGQKPVIKLQLKME